ncbi:hypothetical protein DFH07DRAFT_939981 [Mycena maculata]|uniref:Uncharacterized protein n=1 Tax=Mycena maculata TaxID=230809 RepID=A0AAD7JB85_9AGAR|nr:hypothetical protein DFH07DRAFT_939981 [Mycena maculata]
MDFVGGVMGIRETSRGHGAPHSLRTILLPIQNGEAASFESFGPQWGGKNQCKRAKEPGGRLARLLPLWDFAEKKIQIHNFGSESIHSYLPASMGLTKPNYAKVAEYPVSDNSPQILLRSWCNLGLYLTPFLGIHSRLSRIVFEQPLILSSSCLLCLAHRGARIPPDPVVSSAGAAASIASVTRRLFRLTTGWNRDATQTKTKAPEEPKRIRSSSWFSLILAIIAGILASILAPWPSLSVAAGCKFGNNVASMAVHHDQRPVSEDLLDLYVDQQIERGSAETEKK